MKTTLAGLALALAVGGCGKDSVHHLADAPPFQDAPAHADAAVDATACDQTHCCVAADCNNPNDVCTAAHACVDVTGTLSGLLWQLPCGADSGTSCATTPTATVSATVGGVAGITYDITAHFRGVVEEKTYASACGTTGWVAGGASNGDSYNVYRLTISSPPQTYFLNAGVSGHTYVGALDYVQTFRADAGATVTLFADAVDNAEIKNLDTGGNPISVAGTTVTQPYNGQFIEMDVTTVTPDPIATTSTGTGGTSGHAISLAGAQQVSIADAASLQGTDVTIEAWFTMDGASTGYDSIVGKPYGGTSTDSYTLWYQDGALHAGVNASSPTGTASVAWSVAAGVWHHIALAFDHATSIQTLYLDGEVASCGTTTPASYDTHPFLIGGDIDYGTPGGFWIGALDEVRVWTTARTADQVRHDLHAHQLGATAGLAGEWTFDEGTGQTAADSSGQGNVGTFGTSTDVEASDPTWITSGVPN